MSRSDAGVCCFRACQAEGRASLRLEVTPPPDGAPVVMWAHEACFARLHNASVEPDDPAKHGRIPAKARCAFCGKSLPIVGKHPFVFDVASDSVPQRFWSHAQCMADRLVLAVMADLRTWSGSESGS
jgi:hypothetical protein